MFIHRWNFKRKLHDQQQMTQSSIVNWKIPYFKLKKNLINLMILSVFLHFGIFIIEFRIHFHSQVTQLCWTMEMFQFTLRLYQIGTFMDIFSLSIKWQVIERDLILNSKHRNAKRKPIIMLRKSLFHIVIHDLFQFVTTCCCCCFDGWLNKQVLFPLVEDSEADWEWEMSLIPLLTTIIIVLDD